MRWTALWPGASGCTQCRILREAVATGPSFLTSPADWASTWQDSLLWPSGWCGRAYNAGASEQRRQGRDKSYRVWGLFVPWASWFLISSRPLSRRRHHQVARVRRLADRYKASGLPGMGAVRVGDFINSCLTASKMSWYLWFQANLASFFRSRMRGYVFSVRLGMKCRMDIRQLAQEAFLVVLSLIVAGGDISWIARIFSGSISMPRFYMTNPRAVGGFGALHQH